jgi:predicted nucleic acid-binding protein
MMSLEPGILDANVLIYAIASEAPQHLASRAPVQAVEGWMDLLRRLPVTGADIFDLQLVAVMLANNVNRIYTFNASDFEPFSELSVMQP